MTSVMQVFHW